MPTMKRLHLPAWVSASAETIILVTSLLYFLWGSLAFLTLWLVVAGAYLALGLRQVWGGNTHMRIEQGKPPLYVRWLWLPPALASAVGINAAVTALSSSGQGAQAGATVQAVLASLGVAVSWALLQVAFAQIYQRRDLQAEEPGIRFPDGNRSTLNYLYFSFTVGTSFAVSDTEAVSIPARRLVLVHSIVSFFYNALVVAVAFQVLQGLITHS